jgi:hypothetical protein
MTDDHEFRMLQIRAAIWSLKRGGDAFSFVDGNGEALAAPFAIIHQETAMLVGIVVIEPDNAMGSLFTECAIEHRQDALEFFGQACRNRGFAQVAGLSMVSRLSDLMLAFESLSDQKAA